MGTQDGCLDGDNIIITISYLLGSRRGFYEVQLYANLLERETKPLIIVGFGRDEEDSLGSQEKLPCLVLGDEITFAVFLRKHHADDRKKRVALNRFW